MQQLLKLKEKMKNQILPTTDTSGAPRPGGQERIENLFKAPRLE